ncbi:polysaccharide deacetylase [Lucifera butyrica]|uniref:Polysaccharide deacetylase n=1 Tax=Lucifera butyrica TaxID=1351585 RepID=A0A498R965_9FIRM|nr:polysaccharide deacetylase family protein [Lucifera butyrica]VBB07921.1 polysaccharide deacetylase [Lucifera butyrica]
MTKSAFVFRVLCSLNIFFIIIAVFPFYIPPVNVSAATGPAPVITDSSPPPSFSPDRPEQNSAVYLLPAMATDGADTDKPVYDPYTVTERKEKKLPAALPDVKPYYGVKTVYLTFDDGPDRYNTPLVLDILKKNGIKATFFVVGTQVEKSAPLLKRIYNEGHAIGNHSYNHIYRQLYRSPAAYMEQLRHNDQIIKRILGVRPRIARAPGGTVGSFTKQYWTLLKEEGYTDISWNVSSGDASRAKAADLVQNVIYQMQNKYLWSHAIVLMHDGPGHGETVKALPSIIKYFKDNGFEFKVVNLKTPPAW